MSTTDHTDAREAERDLLAMALTVDWVVADASEVQAEDFHSEVYGDLWRLLQGQHLAGRSTTEAGILLDLKARPRLLEIARDAGQVAEGFLGDFTLRAASHDTYRLHQVIEAVRYAGRMRRMRSLMRQKLAELESGAIDDAAAWWSRAMDEGVVALHGADTGALHIGDVLDPVSEKIDRESRGEEVVYIPTGIRGWDEDPDFIGLSSEGMTLLLAASGMGKTSLVNRLALGLGSTGVAVLLHGTETSRERRTRDLVFTLAGVDAREWARVAAGYAEFGGDPLRRALDNMRRPMLDAERVLSGMPLTISGAGKTVEQVVASARMNHARGKCDVLIVDYLQDLSPVVKSGLRHGDRTAQIGYATGMLKQLAADLHMPVIVAAQVSGEKAGVTGDPRPMMWDTQWSSQAHQDAEEVYALFRGDYYRDFFGPEQWATMAKKGCFSEGRHEIIEVIARKRRVGVKRTLELGFHGPTKWVGDRPRSMTMLGPREVAK